MAHLTISQVAWVNATLLSNNTLTSGYAAHIGQLFWDQDLINAVEATYPYNTNTIDITENADDRVVANEVTDTTSDPFFNYVYLGDSLDDGLFGWVTIGINLSATYSPNYSFEYTDDGGVALGETVGSDNVNGGGDGSMGDAPGGMNGTAGFPNSTGIPSTSGSTSASLSSTGQTTSSISATSSTSAGDVISS